MPPKATTEEDQSHGIRTFLDLFKNCGVGGFGVNGESNNDRSTIGVFLEDNLSRRTVHEGTSDSTSTRGFHLSTKPHISVVKMVLQQFLNEREALQSVQAAYGKKLHEHVHHIVRECDEVNEESVFENLCVGEITRNIPIDFL